MYVRTFANTKSFTLKSNADFLINFDFFERDFIMNWMIFRWIFEFKIEWNRTKYKLQNWSNTMNKITKRRPISVVVEGKRTVFKIRLQMRKLFFDTVDDGNTKIRNKFYVDNRKRWFLSWRKFQFLTFSDLGNYELKMFLMPCIRIFDVGNVKK